MKKILISIVLLLPSSLFFCNAINANNEKLVTSSHFLNVGDYAYSHDDRTSTMLYPETETWIAVNKLKHADSDFIYKNRIKLRDAYVSLRNSKNLNADKCSTIDRVLGLDTTLGKYYSKNFYFGNLGGDRGDNDIIYSGQDACSEGNRTLIWVAIKNEYMLKYNIPHTVLRFKKSGDELLINSIDTACCGARTTTYFLGTSTEYGKKSKDIFFNKTEVPTIKIKPSSFIAKNDLILRYAPLEYNQYSKDDSEFEGTAVFGNIIARFLPGCTGVIVGKKIDANAKLWYFVITDSSWNKSCYPLRTSSVENANIGWIDGATGISTDDT